MQAPDKLTIDTPEQISLEFPLASAGSRFLAIVVDTLIQVICVLALAIVALGALSLRDMGFRTAATWIVAALIICGFVIYYGYFALFEARWGGQTPGKRAIGLRVITLSGQPISTFDAILRNLLRIVDQLPGFYAVGVLSIFVTSRNQRLGDLVAGTVVVHEQPMQRATTLTAQPAAVRLGASRLTADEVAVVEAYLARRNDLPYERRQRTAHQLADRIRQRLELAQSAYRDDEALIEMVAAEGRRRT